MSGNRTDCDLMPVLQNGFWNNDTDLLVLTDANRKFAEMTIKQNHYAHSVPSGKSFYFQYETAIVVFSIPANPFIAKALFDFDALVWELTRLWAPDGHRPNLLTQAISKSIKRLVTLVPGLDAIVSYADPNVGHSGGIYRAASWMYTGQSEESRYYVDKNNQVVARRKFHSGEKISNKAEILSLGYSELKLPGKHRFVKAISNRARKAAIGNGRYAKNHQAGQGTPAQYEHPGPRPAEPVTDRKGTVEVPTVGSNPTHAGVL
jgi:hypothetical protein